MTYRFSNKGKEYSFDTNQLTPDELAKFNKLTSHQKERFITAWNLENESDMKDEISLATVEEPSKTTNFINSVIARYQQKVDALRKNKNKSLDELKPIITEADLNGFRKTYGTEPTVNYLIKYFEKYIEDLNSGTVDTKALYYAEELLKKLNVNYKKFLKDYVIPDVEKNGSSRYLNKKGEVKIGEIPEDTDLKKEIEAAKLRETGYTTMEQLLNALKAQSEELKSRIDNISGYLDRIYRKNLEGPGEELKPQVNVNETNVSETNVSETNEQDNVDDNIKQSDNSNAQTNDGQGETIPIKLKFEDINADFPTKGKKELLDNNLTPGDNDSLKAIKRGLNKPGVWKPEFKEAYMRRPESWWVILLYNLSQMKINTEKQNKFNGRIFTAYTNKKLDLQKFDTALKKSLTFGDLQNGEQYITNYPVFGENDYILEFLIDKKKENKPAKDYIKYTDTGLPQNFTDNFYNEFPVYVAQKINEKRENEKQGKGIKDVFNRLRGKDTKDLTMRLNELGRMINTYNTKAEKQEQRLKEILHEIDDIKKHDEQQDSKIEKLGEVKQQSTTVPSVVPVQPRPNFLNDITKPSQLKPVERNEKPNEPIPEWQRILNERRKDIEPDEPEDDESEDWGAGISKRMSLKEYLEMIN